MARVIDARNAGPMLRSGFELQRDELPLDVPNKINYGTQCSGPLFSFSGVDEPAAVCRPDQANASITKESVDDLRAEALPSMRTDEKPGRVGEGR